MIEKYQIYFDIEALKELNNRIIDNCSLIIHREDRSDYPPRFEDKKLIKNLEYIPVGEKEYFE